MGHRAYSTPPTRNVTLKARVPRPGVPRPYPPSRRFRATYLPVGIESSRSVFCPTQMKGEWTVRHHPYQMKGEWSVRHHPYQMHGDER